MSLVTKILGKSSAAAPAAQSPNMEVPPRPESGLFLRKRRGMQAPPRMRVMRGGKHTEITPGYGHDSRFPSHIVKILEGSWRLTVWGVGGHCYVGSSVQVLTYAWSIGPWQYVFRQLFSGLYVWIGLQQISHILTWGNGHDSHVLNPQGPNAPGHLLVFNSHTQQDNSFFFPHESNRNGVEAYGCLVRQKPNYTFKLGPLGPRFVDTCSSVNLASRCPCCPEKLPSHLQVVLLHRCPALCQGNTKPGIGFSEDVSD